MNAQIQISTRKAVGATAANFLTALVLAVTVIATGCGKSTKPEESTTPLAAAAGADENLNGDSDSGKAGALKSINFPYDSFSLDATAKDTLSANASYLKSKTGIKIQVEGHCDQRGGIQYNIALGEKRAGAVKKYLEDLGITSDRVTTISFGKEKLLDTGTTEAAYAKNRRANFVITSSK
jgi:peptidoglycan-associated lipoprotein